ncbi:MAG: hypothetical protein ABJC89_10895 [Acidobacteriota bacterium]
MKTLVISGGGSPLPGTLRDVIAHGSTSLEERRAADLDPAGPLSDADRVVFWTTGDAAVRALAARYARAENAERKEVVVYITTAAEEKVPDLSTDEIYLWPQDEDSLMLVFMTGA